MTQIEDELNEIRDGAGGDGPATRGAARDKLAKRLNAAVAGHDESGRVLVDPAKLNPPRKAGTLLTDEFAEYERQRLADGA